MLTLTSHGHRPQLAANQRKLRTDMNAHVVPHVGSIVLGLTTDVLLIIGALFGRACITSVISRGATTSSPPRHAPSSNGNRRSETDPRPPGPYGHRSGTFYVGTPHRTLRESGVSRMPSDEDPGPGC
jgi:hypothetical protein